MGPCCGCLCLVLVLAGGSVAGELTPERRDALRSAARAAFSRGDYEAMAEAHVPLAAEAEAAFLRAGPKFAPLARVLETDLDDCLGLAHARRLAGDWDQAVAGYASALALVERVLAACEAQRPANGWPDARPPYRPGDPPPAGRPAPPPRRGEEPKPSARVEGELRARRMALLLSIGRLQRGRLGAPAAAAATFTRCVESVPDLRRSLPDLAAARRDWLQRVFDELGRAGRRTSWGDGWERRGGMEALRELAATQEAMGQLAMAIETRSRLHLNVLTSSLAESGGRQWGELMDIDALAALVQQLPPGSALPRTPLLHVLTPASPRVRLDLVGVAGLAEAYYARPWSRYSLWRYALAPGPGQEFASIELLCDMERLAPEPRERVEAWAEAARPQRGKVALGAVKWPEAEPPGRRAVRQQLTVPPGAGVVHVEVLQRPEVFTLHTVEVRAQFRRRQGQAMPLRTSLRVYAAPGGGTLRFQGQPAAGQTEWDDLAAGRYRISYALPDREAPFTCETDLAPGCSYVLFANPDSPFEWRATNLRGFSSHPPARCSAARLPDGRWLVAFGSPDRRVMLATSDDLIRWTEAWPLPTDGAPAVEPTLYQDEQGTVWLACFCNRTYVGPPAAGTGYGIWLTSTRDGRAWSRPTPVLLLDSGPRAAPFGTDFYADASWYRTGIQMLRGPDGRHWLFWRVWSGAADTPGEIRQLQLTQRAPGDRGGLRNPHVTVDSRGRFLMVSDGFERGIFYRTSTDGRRWSASEQLVEVPPKRAAHDVQLVVDRERAALLYQDNHSCWWLARGTLEPEVAFEPPIQISNSTASLHCSRLFRTPDGGLGVFAGDDGVWLLYADPSRVARPPLGEF